MSTILLTAWLVCQSLDLGTTFIALDKGGREANPILGQSKARIGAIKVTVNGAALIGYFRTQGRKRMILSGTMASAGCFAGGYNLKGR